MTREDDFIRQLESYLDEHEGVTPLPDSVRHAVRAQLPTMKQARPANGLARYFTMNFSKPVTYGIAAAAAILVLVVGAYAFGGRNIGNPAPSEGAASPAASLAPSGAAAVVSASPAPSDSCGSPAVEVREGTIDYGYLEFAWCVPRDVDDRVVVDFTMTAPAEWADQFYSSGEALWLRPAGGGALAFFIGGPDTAEAWVADIQGRPGYDVSGAEPITVGGNPAFALDIGLESGASEDEAAPIFEDPELSWRVRADRVARVWIFDRGDEEALMLVTDAVPTDFDRWIGLVEDAVESIEWDS